MLDKVARLSGTLCLFARDTRLGGIAFYLVNGSCRAICARLGEKNRANMMAARGKLFRSCHLPTLSAEPDDQNDRQYEETNVIHESQAESRPVPVQEAEISQNQGYRNKFTASKEERK